MAYFSLVLSSDASVEGPWMALIGSDLKSSCLERMLKLICTISVSSQLRHNSEGYRSTFGKPMQLILRGFSPCVPCRSVLESESRVL